MGDFVPGVSGSSRRASYISPTGRAYSAAPRGEFCRFLRKNEAFGCPRQRPLATNRQGFEAAMPVRAGMKHRPTGYDGCLAERAVDLKWKISAIFILELIVDRLRLAVGPNLHYVWDATRGGFVLVKRRRNTQSNRVKATITVNC